MFMATQLKQQPIVSPSCSRKSRSPTLTPPKPSLAGKETELAPRRKKKQRQKASDGCTCYWAKAHIVEECGGQTCSSELHPPILSRRHGWRDCVVQSFRVKLDDLVPSGLWSGRRRNVPRSRGAPRNTGDRPVAAQ